MGAPEGSSWLAAAALGLLVAAATLAPLAVALRGHAPAVLEDDGFYYTQIARELARTGRSSFDGLSLTNGYHPLWLWVLAAKTRLIGDATWSVVALEAMCLGAGAGLIVRSAHARAWGAPLVFAALFAHYVGAMSGLGMEVSLFALCAGAFVARLAAREGASPMWDGAWLGVAAGACIGARIDSAVFVLPMLAISSRSRRSRGVAFAVVAAGGLAYAAANLAVFGAALPISSAVKSLGGLQVNRRFIAQMGAELHAFGRDGGGRMLLALASCAAAPAVALLAPRGSAARTIGFGTGVGGALFLAKLLFGSSWRIWPWYDYPLVFSLAAALLALGPRLDAAPRRMRLGGLALGMLALALVEARAVRNAARPPSEDFYAVNRTAAAQVAAATGGAAVAMGDRAGSFAWFYRGPVVQLEGLVNDARWLHLLRRREAPLPELCARGVRYVIAYTPDVKAYAAMRVPLMRPSLTQYPSPALLVRRGDEVLSVKDLAVFDGRDATDGDPVLRLWRLHCPAPAVAPAPPPPAARS
ncbi:MAG: hypothetical protein INR64_02205 [Caulobacteraceae bacterium]|nr:hypothetical protein [Caulobacter sp.]